MLTGPNVILLLKIAVGAVTLILIASLIALARGNRRLHGRLNTVFFVLTVVALLGLEVVVRMLDPDIFNYFEEDPALRQSLKVHLCFSLPAAGIMPFMLLTGYKHKRKPHLILAAVFSALWIGTFVTGIFFLPHGP